MDEVNGFLGYFDEAAKQTSCGNCHASFQQQWAGTVHADAWADLQNSGHAQTFCSGCHTVSELGNPTATAAGYNAVADNTYHDVQCESCHGAGFEHASLPDGVAGPPGPIGGPEEIPAAAHGCRFANKRQQQPNSQRPENKADREGNREIGRTRLERS